MFRIERGVPLIKSVRRGKNCKYPWHDMEVGDSFVVPIDGSLKRPLSTMSSLCMGHSQNGKQFQARQMPEGIRVWRTA